MPSGIEYFFTQGVRKPADDHKWRLGWWTLDTEALHNDVLQILLTESKEFSAALLTFEGRCHRPKSTFDLVVENPTGGAAYIEIKVWAPWSPHQQKKQLTILGQSPSSHGFVVLLGKQAVLSRDQVAAQFQGAFTKISYSDLVEALGAVRGEQGLCEVAAAYKLGLEQHEARLRKQYPWDPNQ